LEKNQIQDDQVFKALAGTDRRRILDLLKNEPMTTGDIGKRLKHLDRTTVMQHLGVLEKAAWLLQKKRAGVAGISWMLALFSASMSAGLSRTLHLLPTS
jgi:DNA-binding transcriptional ArsR family regulator|tara:strand:+ start:89 stop:385 length:297 start_codon:yes stop_codon:yes gene_type:complete